MKKTVAFAVGCFYLLTLPMLVAAAPVVSPVEPTIIRLQAGVTGDKIQDALDSLPAVGGEVVLPPGNIFVHQPIILRRDHQTLRGSGAATVLRLVDHANSPVLIIGQPVNAPRRTVKNLCVRDLTIDGNRKNQTRELWKLAGEGSEIRNNGLTIQAVENSVVENVIAAHNRSGGLVTTLGVRHLTVKNFESFDNEFDGLACYLTEESTFTGLNLHHNPGAGISLDLSFNYNVISNATLTANDLGIFMRSSNQNKFFGVSIKDSHHHGVFIAQAEEFRNGLTQPAPMTECTHNAFTNLAALNNGGAAIRVNDATCTNNVIIGSRFNGNRKGNLSLAEPNLVTVR